MNKNRKVKRCDEHFKLDQKLVCLKLIECKTDCKREGAFSNLVNVYLTRSWWGKHQLYLRTLPPPAGGGVTLRGSDGQLHPRAPPKPLRISAVFPNAIIPPPTRRDVDPSSFYDELVVQVTCSLSIFKSRCLCLSKQRGLPVNSLKHLRTLPVARRSHRPGTRATWTDCVQRRSGRAGPASRRRPSASWTRLHSRL